MVKMSRTFTLFTAFAFALTALTAAAPAVDNNSVAITGNAVASNNNNILEKRKKHHKNKHHKNDKKSKKKPRPSPPGLLPRRAVAVVVHPAVPTEEKGLFLGLQVKGVCKAPVVLKKMTTLVLLP
jgi:hypothetical protein